MFIHVILMDVLDDKFPGRLAIQSLLELILVSEIKEQRHSKESNSLIYLSMFSAYMNQQLQPIMK